MLQVAGPTVEAGPVDTAIAFVRSLGAPDDVSLTPLRQGCHNAVFLCENGPPDYPEKTVVRVPGCPEAARAAEVNAIYLEGMPAPQTLKVGDLAVFGAPVILEEYVEGETVEDLSQLSPAHIDNLASTLAYVHARTNRYFSPRSGTPPNRPGTYEDYLRAMLVESVTARLQRIDMSKYPDARRLVASGTEKMGRLVAASVTSFQGDRHSLLQHDLSPGNMLWRPDASVRLIDWNMTYGDPADDVDYVVTNNRPGRDFTERFHERYLAHSGGEDVMERLGAYTLKNLMDDLAWVIMMRKRCPDDPNYDGEQYEQRVEALESALAA